MHRLYKTNKLLHNTPVDTSCSKMAVQPEWTFCGQTCIIIYLFRVLNRSSWWSPGREGRGQGVGDGATYWAGTNVLLLLQKSIGLEDDMRLSHKKRPWIVFVLAETVVPFSISTWPRVSVCQFSCFPLDGRSKKGYKVNSIITGRKMTPRLHSNYKLKLRIGEMLNKAGINNPG